MDDGQMPLDCRGGGGVLKLRVDASIWRKKVLGWFVPEYLSMLLRICSPLRLFIYFKNFGCLRNKQVSNSWYFVIFSFLFNDGYLYGLL